MIDQPQRAYEFDEFRLDVLKRQLTRDGEVVPLYSKAFDLLLALVQSSGQDLSKDELLEAVWPGQMLEEANLTVNMSAVRKALGEKAAQPRYIINIPGRGYRFVGEVRAVEAQGVLIETETISHVTIEEETDGAADALDASAQTRVGPADESAALLAGGAIADPQTSTQPDRNSLLKRPALMLVIGSFLLLAVLGSIYLWRSRSPKASARFKEIKLRQLTNDGGVITAAISPDGKFFAVVQAEKTGGRQKLRLVQTNGASPIDLRPFLPVTHRQVEFAPDGNSVYYSLLENGQPGLFRLPVLGGVPVKLRDAFGSAFAISPDGRRLAFLRGDSNNRSRNVLLTNSDGTNETTVVEIPPKRNLNPVCLSWSPDGTMLAVSASPEGNQSGRGLYLVNVANGQLQPLGGAAWREVDRIAWLKDGSGVLAVAAPASTEDDPQIWLTEYPSGSVRQITNDLNNYDNVLSVATDSKTMLTTEHQQINNVWVAESNDLSKAKQLTFGASSRADGLWGVDWTPDRRLVYTSAIGKSHAIWIMDGDGGNARQLTALGSVDMAPSVSGDGRFIVFDSSRNGGRDVWRVNIDGSSVQQLTTCGRTSQPSVTADNKWIVYKSGCDSVGGLWRIPVNGGEPQRLTDHGASWPWTSPDSKWIACEYSVSQGVNKLAIISIDGGPPEKLFDVPQSANFRFGIKWSADGKFVTYRDWLAGIWRQSIDGGEPQRVTGLPDEKIYANSWSRDGKMFAFTRGVEIRDVVLISTAP